MTSRHRCRGLLAGAFFLLATAAAATPQVVGDEACARYEVDMASFASFTDGKVVRPDATDIPVFAVEDRARYTVHFAPEARSRAGYLLAAIMPGFDVASGTRQRPDDSRGCTSAPHAPLRDAQ